jgi:hypothetical protein
MGNPIHESRAENCPRQMNQAIKMGIPTTSKTDRAILIRGFIVPVGQALACCLSANTKTNPGQAEAYAAYTRRQTPFAAAQLLKLFSFGAFAKQHLAILPHLNCTSQNNGPPTLAVGACRLTPLAVLSST